jgi:hypothetical protein
MLLDGKASVDADEIAKCGFFEQVAQRGQDRIFPTGRYDAGIIVQCLEINDLVELQLDLFGPVLDEDGIRTQRVVQ